MSDVVHSLDRAGTWNEAIALPFDANEELVLKRRVEEHREVRECKHRSEILKKYRAPAIENVEVSVGLFDGIGPAGPELAAIAAIEVHVDHARVDALVRRTALVACDAG